MNAPASQPEEAVAVSHEDKAFVFGGTVRAGDGAGPRTHVLDVQVSGGGRSRGP